MKPLIVNTYTIGGAATAAYRLHYGLLDAGINSKFLHAYGPDKIENEVQLFPEISFQQKVSTKLKKKINHIFHDIWLSSEEAIIKKRPKSFDFFSFPRTDFNITNHTAYKDSDLVNLHWVANLIDYQRFFKTNTKPTFWTLHDMNAFTGGCHYSNDCIQFNTKCIKCPQLEGTGQEKVISKYWELKLKSIQESKNLKFICLSEWMQDNLLQSSIGTNRESVIIRNGLDENIFKPYPKNIAKSLFNLPSDKIILLFVSQNLNNERKGFSILEEAINLVKNKNDFHFVAVGGGTGKRTKNIQYIQHINDQRLMPLLYSAADAYIIPSLMDNMPNTIAEAQLCGTPVIGFKNTGIKEMIKPNLNGILVENFTAQELANVIENLATTLSKFDIETIRSNAVKEYSLKRQVDEYIKLFKSL
ncbi:glycosyltransferase [Winogradskyella sp.]|nr:glycosyltransferase [Winogradskyella sp.]